MKPGNRATRYGGQRTGTGRPRFEQGTNHRKISKQTIMSHHRVTRRGVDRDSRNERGREADESCFPRPKQRRRDRTGELCLRSDAENNGCLSSSSISRRLADTPAITAVSEYLTSKVGCRQIFVRLVDLLRTFRPSETCGVSEALALFYRAREAVTAVLCSQTCSVTESPPETAFALSQDKCFNASHFRPSPQLVDFIRREVH
jgi:hypothetical protein